MLQPFDTAYFLAWVLAFLFGTGIEKFVQAMVALILGDSSPKSKNRLTLNPVAHHEPLGLIFGFMLSVHYPIVTWGKPVEINPFSIRGGRLGRSLVGLVGPLTYFFLAFIIWIASKPYLTSANFRSDFIARLLLFIIVVNLSLCAFNLIPIPPLDGYDILRGFLPAQWETRLLWLEKYGIAVLVVLLLFIPFFLRIDILNQFYVSPIVSALSGLIDRETLGALFQRG